jgi:phytoene dehydrogenase-like protein
MSEITRRGFVKGAALAPLAFTGLPLEAKKTAAIPGDRFDIVVAGAGHNSLITAAYLSKAGFRCLVLEFHPVIGGGVKSEELTLPGYKHDTCSTAHNGIQGNPLMRNDELKLKDYGLEYISPDPIMHMPFADGSYITQWTDLERTAEEFAKFSKKDGEAYVRMYHESEAAKDLLGGDQFAPPGTGKPLSERLAANPMGKFWQRRLAMSQWEVIRENFESDHCRAFLMGTPWSMQPPQYPMTGRAAYSAIRTSARKIAKGGSGMLTQALAKFIEAHNGVILVNKTVSRLIIESGKCVGVECADGSSYRADKAVLSTMHIKNLVEMAPHDLWPADFLYGVDTWEGEISEVVTHYAVKEPPKYPIKGGTISPAESAVLASSDRLLRFAYDDDAGISNIDEPPISIFCSTVADPSRAPAGMHTLKVLGFHPYNLKEGPQHWDVLKTQVADAQLAYLRRFAPNLTDDKILAKFTMSPLDLERRNPSFWHGSIHAGSSDPSQSGAMRPMAGWAQYRMPIPGLYQTGATTYPGGSVTGAPGRNAAMVMLKDLGTSIEEVVAKGS